MITSLPAAIAGSSDLERSVAFLTELGFAETGRGRLAAAAAKALYGLDGEPEQVLLEAPDAGGRGALRLVSTPYPATKPQPFVRGPHALDIYTTDLDTSLTAAEDAGAGPARRGSLEVGDATLEQAAVRGPDELQVVFVATARRRSSLLDQYPARLHSEAYGIVWVVGALDAAVSWLTERLGLQVGLELPWSGPEISRLMDLPRDDVPVRLTLLGDAELAPMRLELLCYPDDRTTSRPTWPLRAGLYALSATVEDLEPTVAKLDEAGVGAIVEVDPELHPGKRAVAVHTPQGVRFELYGS